MFLRVYSSILLTIIFGGGVVFPIVNHFQHIATGPFYGLILAGLFAGCIAAFYAAIPLLVLMTLVWLAFVRAI